MAAILEPRTMHGGSHQPAHRPARPPRHLSAVSAAAPVAPTLPRATAVPRPVVEQLLPPSTVAAMVAAVVVAVLLAVGVGAGAFSALVPEPGSSPVAAGDGRVVVVEPGDSVWSIAREVQPRGDVRPLVHSIIQANGADQLRPGDRIVVPG